MHKKGMIIVLSALLLIGILIAPAFAETKKVAGGPGKIPFDYPTVATTAKAGDYVMYPPRMWIDKAFTDGADKQTFIFYGGTMVEPGPVESKVKDLMGKEETIPNSLIVPIRKGGTAKPGDMVLSWWQSGSGMYRAVVVKGGTPKEPKVLYTDMDYDNPSGCAKKVDQLKPDTFHVLSGTWAPGSSIASKDPTWGWKHGTMINSTSDKVLILGYAGRMYVEKKTGCMPLPVTLKVKAGDVVMFPSMGTFKSGKVKKVDTAIGRVFLVYQWGGKDATTALGFGQLISTLPK